MINILISVDSNYIDKAQTMLFSMRMHTQEDITVYLLNHALPSSAVAQFASFLQKKCRMDLQEIDVHKTALDDMPVGEYNFTIEMYYRILAQFLLPDTLDRILWIDADTVVLQDIAPFYHQEFGGAKYVVCSDSQNGSSFVQACIKRLALPDSHTYFNSGVLLMDLALLRRETDMTYIFEQSRLLRDKLEFPDQDILNYLYQGQVKYADWKKYNYQLATIKRLPKEEAANIVILHYTGKNKPWNYWQIANVSKYCPKTK